MSATSQPRARSLPAAPPVFGGVPQSLRPATVVPVRSRARFTDGGWTTPRRLQAFLLSSLLLATLLFAMGFNLHNTFRQGVQSVGRDSVPSILAAQQIHSSLVDMDVSAANDLLAGANGSRTARDSYDAERSFIGRQTVVAAQNITYGTLERIPIEQLQDGMTYYTGLVAQAQQQLRGGNSDIARGTFTLASAYLHSTLVPAAQRLDDVNTAYLNRAYSDSRTTNGWALTFVVLAGVLFLLALIGAQLFLARRVRRTLNLPLLAASVLVIVFLVNTVSTTLAVNAELKIAKGEAFDSISALADARALVFDANGSQALSLLDTANTMRYQNQYTQLTQQIADTTITPSIIDRATRTPNDPGFKGALATELRNLTFRGEKDAALTALTGFSAYQQANTQIRQLQMQGKTADALALITGTNTDQANRVFERFDIALTRVININRAEFENAVTRSFAMVAPLQWLSPAAALLIGLLAFLGLQPRLREYAV